MRKHHIHIVHPSPLVMPPILEWLASVQGSLRVDPDWDDWEFNSCEMDQNADFNVPTLVDIVRSRKGPVIFIEKVQKKLFLRFREMLALKLQVVSVTVACSKDIYSACSQMKDGHLRASNF